ncbi:NADP-dependent oxidoreductase [Bacillaceae bacterium SIJ1]|uniref:NADP-dependent oxidoreductase n=1 Tax=Litoribacterium kuwaitense TaxID=1398745 RepID=UPI0013EAEF4C|nr:NADP-dependent oxidoreductase [Litoribacterium kuwaitense]NGP45235.1 NADP-dependent oxidoreductase [Litoribacterium kuwaitense]
MKAVVIEQYGGKEQLVERDIEKPVPGKGQVLVEVKATSVNPIDWKVREGYLQSMMDWEFPIILGWDVAGFVKEVGEGVDEWKPGDEVFARPQTTRFGTYAEFTVVDAHLLAQLPQHVSMTEAAAVPLAGLTAWQGMFDHAALKEGEKILIHAGAGGVGHLAIQLAKAKGAYVITTCSAKNASFVRELGADEVIDYKTTDFSEVVNDVDVVFDTVGGEVMNKSFQVLKKGSGRLISITGQPDADEAKNAGISASGFWLQPNGEQLKELGKFLENGTLRPLIAETFELSSEGVQKAHALSETGHARGKIIIAMQG